MSRRLKPGEVLRGARALARRLAQGEQADTTDPAGDDEELLAFAAPVLATVGTILGGGR